jgi:hypothetical protein
MDYYRSMRQYTSGYYLGIHNHALRELRLLEPCLLPVPMSYTGQEGRLLAQSRHRDCRGLSLARSGSGRSEDTAPDTGRCHEYECLINHKEDWELGG